MHALSHKKGSYTVEASLLMPIFALVMVFALLFFRMIAVGWGINSAIRTVAYNTSLYSATDEDGKRITKNTIIGAGDIMIAKNKVPMKYIFGSYVGLDYKYSELTDREIDILVQYNVPIRIGGGFFHDRNWHMMQRSKAKRWNGYDPHEGEDGEDDYVYVTEYGSVYHENINCSYLSSSIHVTDFGSIGRYRSRSTHKYYACESCGGNSQTVYFTDYGERYHSSLTCSGLKRTIHRVKRSELNGRYPPCPKCA